MSTIAKYVASVGVEVDKSSISRINTYLTAIEKNIKRFQSKLNSMKPLNIKIKVDKLQIQEEIQRSLTKATIRLDNVKLSSNSIQTIRNQLKTQLSDIKISPTLSPKYQEGMRMPSGGGGRGGGDYSGGGGRSSLNSGSFVKGGFGGVVTQGHMAIIGLGGAWGLRSMEKKAAKMDMESLMFYQATGGDEEESKKQYQGIIDIAHKLAVVPEDIIRNYITFFTGMRSRGMGDYALEGFENILKLAKVSGTSPEQVKGITRALFQIISKGKFMSEEVKQQMAEHGIPQVIPILTKATGSKDQDELFERMQRSEITVESHLIPFLDLVGKEAEPGMKRFKGSVTESSGNVAASMDRVAREFLGSDVAQKSWQEVTDGITYWLEKARGGIENWEKLLAFLTIPSKLLIDSIGKSAAAIISLAEAITESNIVKKIVDYHKDEGEADTFWGNAWEGFKGVLEVTKNLALAPLKSLLTKITSVADGLLITTGSIVKYSLGMEKLGGILQSIGSKDGVKIADIAAAGRREIEGLAYTTAGFGTSEGIIQRASDFDKFQTSLPSLWKEAVDTEAEEAVKGGRDFNMLNASERAKNLATERVKEILGDRFSDEKLEDLLSRTSFSQESVRGKDKGYINSLLEEKRYDQLIKSPVMDDETLSKIFTGLDSSDRDSLLWGAPNTGAIKIPTTPSNDPTLMERGLSNVKVDGELTVKVDVSGKVNVDGEVTTSSINFEGDLKEQFGDYLDSEFSNLGSVTVEGAR